MGTTVQAEDYVILFTASWETFEDTLLFFHHDLAEALLREPGWPMGCGRVVGVHVSQLKEDCSFHDCFVAQDDALRRKSNCEPIKPALVHLLHFGEEHEIDAHRRLARRMETAGIALINPYSDAVAHCDSKLRMSETLRDNRVATPATKLVSRFTENKTQAVENIRRQSPEMDLYIHPDRGTEATGCVLLEKDEPAAGQWWECDGKQDLIVRERVGNLTYRGHDFVLRINVTYDGKTFSADSGYCMVGGPVVSAAHGAEKENINRVLDQLGLRPDEIDRINDTACAALRAVSAGSVPPRLAGVDLVLEKRDSLTAYVIDINPRPVAVGSRIIGSNAIGLGDHFWNGVRDFRTARSPDHDP
jgi:hypothetical protein